MMHDAHEPEYEVPTWLLETSPRHPFVIYRDDDEAQPWL